jgi:hypothetical protein
VAKLKAKGVAVPTEAIAVTMAPSKIKDPMMALKNPAIAL